MKIKLYLKKYTEIILFSGLHEYYEQNWPSVDLIFQFVYLIIYFLPFNEILARKKVLKNKQKN